MSRTLYDSTTPDSIPADAELALGYVGGSWPTYRDGSLRKRCPNATLVSTAVNASEDADVLDVERGDATPTQSPDWIVRQRRRGSWVRPTIYCDFSTWPQVEAAVSHLPRPAYIIADYDDVAEVPQEWIDRGCVAKQYRSDKSTNLDYSIVVDDSWHSSAAAHTAPISPEEAMAKFGLTQIAFVPSALATLTSDHDGRLPFYGTRPDGALFAFNGARPIVGLKERNIVREDVVGIAVLPDGSGVVLACDDGAPDPADSDGWGASTFLLK